MPNWVFNYLSIEGSEKEIEKVKAQVGATIAKEYRGAEEEEDTNPVFSFMNILPPPKDKLDEYHGTHGYTSEGRVGDTNYNWYNFNTREWGTKWDAKDAELVDENKTYLNYRFDTAWSPPIPVIKKLSEQNPELTITLSYEEESEWGGEVEYLAGEEVSASEYDSPNSHKDYADRDRSCNCQNDSDKEYWFDDCPGKKEKPIKLYATQDVVLTKEK